MYESYFPVLVLQHFIYLFIYLFTVTFPHSKPHPPVAVQGDDVERHRGDVHSEPLGVGQQEAEGAAELPLSLQRVDEGEGEAQRVHQQVGWRQRRREVHSRHMVENIMRIYLNKSVI